MAPSCAALAASAAQAEELGTTLRDAATRVFSNAAGSYSANVGLAIENGGWEDEGQLQEQFLSRKGFAFNADKPGILDQQNGPHRPHKPSHDPANDHPTHAHPTS